MKQVRTLVVEHDLRACVGRLAERLGSPRVEAAKGWQHIVEQCRVESSIAPNSRTLVFGPPAFVLKHAATAEADFGVVMAVAQRSRPWQRAATWRDDATLGLWRLGWSPKAVDRMLVPTDDAIVEFAIAHVRRIPLVTE